MNKQEIEEYIQRALVAGKADSSNLAGHILDKLDKGIQVGIEKYVNGNLRDIKQHLGEQDVKLDSIDKKVELLKVETKPAVTTVSFMMMAGKVVLWLAGAIMAVSGAVIIVLELMEKYQ